MRTVIICEDSTGAPRESGGVGMQHCKCTYYLELRWNDALSRLVELILVQDD
jgi:hypothetical protein